MIFGAALHDGMELAFRRNHSREVIPYALPVRMDVFGAADDVLELRSQIWAYIHAIFPAWHDQCYAHVSGGVHAGLNLLLFIIRGRGAT